MNAVNGRRAANRPPGRWFLILLLVVCTPPADATQVKPLNLEELSRDAARIVWGRCVEVRVEPDAARGRPVTVVTLEVGRVLKGRGAQTLTLRMAGGIGMDGRSTIPGMPSFQRDEEVVLFLYGESRSGLTSPVGLGQGRFLIRTDARGQRLAVNESANRTLFRGLSQRALDQLGEKGDRWRERGGVPPEALLSMVEALLHGAGPP